MSLSHARRRLEAQALIVGYAMSRLDREFLSAFGLRTWRAAYEHAAECLNVPPATLKNLRDEFDPFHGNGRRGWRGRELRPDRQRVLAEFCELSDEAVLEIAREVLAQRTEYSTVVIDAIAAPERPVHNVAERLLTGRRAEQFFQTNCLDLVGVSADDLIDVRERCCGYDFAIQRRSDVVIEVKGLKAVGGVITFTDREWTEAKVREDNYWVVVVGNLAAAPVGRVWTNPVAQFEAKCRYGLQIAVTWNARVSLNDSPTQAAVLTSHP